MSTKQYFAEYYKKNKNIIKLKRKKFREKNFIAIRKKEVIREKKYFLTNPERIRKRKRIRQNFRRKNDIQFYLSYLLRVRLAKALKRNFKNGSAVKDLGCTIPELKIYLENKFEKGMTWDNHGHKSWHIDHIIPISSFDLTKRKEIKKACHYSNLQPMWAEENWKKGYKII